VREVRLYVNSLISNIIHYNDIIIIIISTTNEITVIHMYVSVDV